MTASILFVAGSFFPACAHAQVSGGGDPTDPQNPNNWSVTATQQGADTGVSWANVFGAPTAMPYANDWVPTTLPYPIPFGLNPRSVATNATNTPQTITAASQGSCTLTFTWIGTTGYEPRKLLLEEFSNAFYDGAAGATVKLDNGLGSPVVWSADGTHADCDGMKLVEVVVNGFTATVTLSTNASASLTIPMGGVGVMGSNMTAVVSARWLSVGASLGPDNYHKKLTGRHISAGPWTRGEAGQAAPGYDEAVPELTLGGDDANGIFVRPYNVGLPLISWDFSGDPNDKYLHVDLHASQSAPFTPTSRFAWATPIDHTSGTLPGWAGGWDIDDAGQNNYFLPVKNIDDSVTPNAVGTADQGQVTYTWFDGYSKVAQDTFRLYHERDNTTFVGQDCWIDHPVSDIFGDYLPLVFKDYRDTDHGWAPPLTHGARTTAQKGNSIITAAAHIGELITSSINTRVTDIRIKILLVALGWTLKQVNIPDIDEWWTEDSGTEFTWAVANTPAQGEWIDRYLGDPITPELVREYHWQVRALPLWNADYYVADKYGLDGYEGQEVFDGERYIASRRTHYAFRLDGPGPND